MSSASSTPNPSERLHFRNDRSGNFAIATALVLPLVLASVGIGIDLSRLLESRTSLQGALDAASLAAASALANGKINSDEVTSYAAKIAVSQFADGLSDHQKATLNGSIAASLSTTGSGAVKTYTVKVTGSFSEPLIAFAAFYGDGAVDINGTSVSQSTTQSTNALSLYLVLDRSGSMSFVTDTVDTSQSKCQNYTESNWGSYPNLQKTRPCYVNKMGSLKVAAATLFDELDAIESADPANKVVRVGAVSFTDATQPAQSISWGTTPVRTYVNGLPGYPTGGTDMTGGMSAAYNALTSASEASAQQAKGNSKFYKFLVLMTDGENTGASGAWNPVLDTQTLATCKNARDAGITIYAVGYMAPANGVTLLKACAGNASNYFSANDMASLVNAFETIGTKVTQQTTRMTN